MSKPLLLGFSIFLWLPIGTLSGQVASDTMYAAQYLQRSIEILENEENTDSVAIYLENARKIYIQNRHWNSYISNTINTAKAFYNVGYFQEGIKLLSKTDKDVSKYNTSYTQKIETLYQIARGYYFLKAYDKCIQLVEENLNALSKNIDSTALVFADHYNLLGVCNEGKGLYQKALSFFEKTLAIRLEKLTAAHNQVASVLNNMGNQYSYLGLYSKALTIYNRALSIRTEVLGKNNPNLANILFNIGALYDDKGEYNQAIQHYEHALSIFQANPSEFEARIADIFTNLATIYKSKGAYQKSTSYYQQAIQKYEQLPDDQSGRIADVYTNWANLLELQKDYTKTIDLQQQAITLFLKTLAPTHPRVVIAQNNQGVNYYKNGEYAKALVQLQNIVPLIEKDSTQREQYANLCNDLADVHFKLENLPEAKSYNEKALAIQQTIFGNKSYKLAYTYNSLAQIAENQGNQDAALQYLQQALASNHADFQAEDVNAAPSPQGFYRYDYFVESLLHKARLMRVGGNQTALLQARFFYEVADSTLMLVRNELLSSEDKIRLSEKVYEVSKAAIENYVQLTQATGDTRYWEQAFAYSEKTKANLLFQSLVVNQNKRFAGVPDSLLTLEESLESDLNSLKINLAELPDTARDQQRLLQDALFETQNRYGKLVAELQQNYPAYFQLKYEQKIPDVRTIQKTLSEQMALVSYFTGDSILYSFVLTKADFKVYQSPIDKDLYEEQISGLPRTIAGRLDVDYVALASDLYQKLFPFTFNKNIKSLLIVPDGALTTLPFETLLTKHTIAKSEIDFAKLPYLLNSYQISYASSAALYHQQTTTRVTAEPSEGLLAYAPVFSETENLDNYNSNVRGLVGSVKRDGTRMMTRDGAFISPLPATANEVRAISAVFNKKGQSVKTYFYQNATEKQLKQSEITRSRYLHIATHGMVAEDQPDLSGLLFFPDTSAQGEDHILHSGEVYNLHLNALLVVLSACETGLGKLASGEGLLGLSRAFQFAGSKNLVVSLWQVDDNATADLMKDFYQLHLQKESSQFAPHLRQAKLNMIRSKEKSHPYYWSPFVLIGK